MQVASYFSSHMCYDRMSYRSGKNYSSPLKWHKALRNTHFISRVTDAYIKVIPVYWSFSEANCHTRFGICADKVSYLFKFETKWHQILETTSRYNDKAACRKKLT